MPNIQFQLRRGTASTWTSTNPTLANGEFGFETDTRQLKIGNNVAWNVLPYLNIGQAANWSAFPAYQTVDMSVNILNNVGSIRNGAGSVSAPSYTFMNDVSMGLYDPSTNVLGIVTSGLERMRVAANGNVGIATNNPTFTLDVSGVSRFGNPNSSYGNIAGFVNIDSGALGTTLGNIVDHMAIRSTNGNNTDQLRFYSRRDLNGGASWQSAPLIIQRYVDGTLNPFGFIKFGGSSNNQGVSIGSGSTDTLNVTSGGLVGIGTPSPNAKLGISSSSTGGVFDAIKLTTTGPVANSTHRIGISNYATYGAVIDFIEESGVNFNSLMSLKVSDNGTLTEGIRIAANGRVGILCNAPAYPLHVAGSTTSNLTVTFFQVGSTNLSSLNFNWQIGIASQNSILTSGAFIAASDGRIKTNLQDISDGESLQQLRLIEPTSYEYVDKITKGNQRVYGFIAQQIREVLPHAVTLQKHIVPDIYDLADVSGTTVTLRNKTFTYSDISATVNMILQETGKQDVSANFYPPNTIELHQPFQQDVSQAFVYGRKVDDFHTLDKDAIFTINVAATQELDRQLQAAKDKIQSLENRLSMLENR